MPPPYVVHSLVVVSTDANEAVLVPPAVSNRPPTYSRLPSSSSARPSPADPRSVRPVPYADHDPVARARTASPLAATAASPRPTPSKGPATNRRCPSLARARTTAMDGRSASATPPLTSDHAAPSHLASRAAVAVPPATEN